MYSGGFLSREPDAVDRFAIALVATLIAGPAASQEFWIDRLGNPISAADPVVKATAEGCGREVAGVVMRLAFASPRPSEDQIKATVDAEFSRCMASKGYRLK